MINIQRRKRQADENSNIIMEKVIEIFKTKQPISNENYLIKSSKDIDALVKKLETKVFNVARNIEPNWAIPILIDMISKLYYGKYSDWNYMGPTIKRTLVYIFKNHFHEHGDAKNISTLLDVIYQSFILENLYNMQLYYVINSNAVFEIKNGYIISDKIQKKEEIVYGYLNSGRGKRLRVSEINTELMNNKPEEYLEALISVLDGNEPRDIKVFNETFYEYIPGIGNKECKKFWQELFFRYLFYLSCISEKLNDIGCIIFSEFVVEVTEGYFTQEIVENTFWKEIWINKYNKCDYSNLIVERPILRISKNGDFATSAVIIGDSINYFIESHIFHYTNRTNIINLPQSIFKDAFSTPFEHAVENIFRDLNIIAGNVNEKGCWRTQKGDVLLSNSRDHLYGEIDVLAYDALNKICVIVECKVINDVRNVSSLMNIIGKLSTNDSEGFRVKTIEKMKWIKGSSLFYNLENEVNIIPLLVTDISMPVIDNTDNDVILVWFDLLKGFLHELYNGTTINV